jgi:IMP dehydrogenase
VIADGGVGTSGTIVKALAMGADADQVGAAVDLARGPVQNLLQRPRGAHARAHAARDHLVGALRRAMSTTGYLDLKSFQRTEVVVHG